MEECITFGCDRKTEWKFLSIATNEKTYCCEKCREQLLTGTFYQSSDFQSINRGCCGTCKNFKYFNNNTRTFGLCHNPYTIDSFPRGRRVLNSFSCDFYVHSIEDTISVTITRTTATTVPVDEYIPFMQGRPERDHVINNDDINNLKINLEVCEGFYNFIASV